MRVNSLKIAAIVDSHIISYPTPKNLNYMWSFGSGAGICLGIQILTGVFLAMHYVPKIEYAFYSVEHIMRNVKYGWILRYLHANGASMFFIVVYAHIFRGLFYGSYMHPRQGLWVSGVVIYILMMATAFIGYVLPWGQMSFWGATVITNLFSTIPFVGVNIVEWIWGGFSVGGPTLNRFFSLHFLVPFLIAGAVFIHLALLHEVGSNNPLGVDCHEDKIYFYPYLYVKDLISFFLLLLTFSYFVFFYPNLLNHSDNYIQANPLVTPSHIVPEWYFLPFYAILRCVPHKLGGVIAMGSAIVCLLVLPFINTSEVRNTNFRPLFIWCFWVFFFNFVFLGWIGQKEVEEPFVTLGIISSIYYFSFFLVIIPGLNYLENFLLVENDYENDDNYKYDDNEDEIDDDYVFTDDDDDFEDDDEDYYDFEDEDSDDFDDNDEDYYDFEDDDEDYDEDYDYFDYYNDDCYNDDYYNDDYFNEEDNCFYHYFYPEVENKMDTSNYKYENKMYISKSDDDYYYDDDYYNEFTEDDDFYPEVENKMDTSNYKYENKMDTSNYKYENKMYISKSDDDDYYNEFTEDDDTSREVENKIDKSKSVDVENKTDTSKSDDEDYDDEDYDDFDYYTDPYFNEFTEDDYFYPEVENKIDKSKSVDVENKIDKSKSVDVENKTDTSKSFEDDPAKSVPPKK